MQMAYADKYDWKMIVNDVEMRSWITEVTAYFNIRFTNPRNAPHLELCRHKNKTRQECVSSIMVALPRELCSGRYRPSQKFRRNMGRRVSQASKEQKATGK
jgi:hypothetical protein